MALRRTAALSALLVAVAGTALVGAPPALALDAPSGLTQESAGAAGPGIPVLRWDPVLGATGYDVQVGGTTVTTSNSRYVPTWALKSGTGEFQVRSRVNSETSPWASGTYSTAAVAGPEPRTPAQGAVLTQPTEPPLFTWSPAPGALDYEMRYGTDPTFTSLTTVVNGLRSPQTLLNRALIAQTYYWQVRARLGNGVHSEWSADPSGSALPRTFRVAALAPAQRSEPATDTTVQTDVVFDWDPIPGARTYTLQISTNENFTSDVIERRDIAATRYSPEGGLKNDEYYWRVRAVDASGNPQDWSAAPVWRFQRDWTEQPVLTWPQDAQVVGNPFHFEWDPVPGASSYRVDLSPTPFSSVHPVNACYTRSTTLTPFATNQACRPQALGTYHWRVVAIDDGHNPALTTDVLGATVHTFSYDPGVVTYTAPADGADVAVPELSWEPVADAATYEVRITKDSDRATGYYAATTSALSHTPTQLATNCSPTPQTDFLPCAYRWDVVWRDVHGNMGPARTLGSQRSFRTLPAPAGTGTWNLTSTTPGQRLPRLSWAPIGGAQFYRVFAKPSTALPSNAGTHVDNAQPTFASWTPIGTAFSAPGTYLWRVEAYSPQGNLIGSSGFEGTFTVLPLPMPDNRRVAHTGLAVTSGEAVGTSCSQEDCLNLRNTPVLRWDPHPNTGAYKLWLSRNKEMTNLVFPEPPVIAGTLYAFTSELPDMQAGQAYYWYVQPCTTGAATTCTPATYAQNTFNKLSNPVELVGTGATCTPTSTHADDITFCWKDWLETNTTIGQGNSELATPGRLEANTYQIEISTNPTFETVNVRAEVQQTTYTPTFLLPDGVLHWRVRAKDGSNNWLTWSAPGTLTKQSPVPILTSPAEGSTVSGDVTLQWAPQNFAGNYTVEIYRQGDRTAQLVNREVNATGIVPSAWAGNGPLAPGAWTWRMRRSDATLNPGAWSEVRGFTVSETVPVASQPTGNVEVLRNGALFSWEPVSGAATYALERRAAGSTATTVLLNSTVATQWAPTATLANGDAAWRVIARNLNGAVLGTSAWASYRVAGALAMENPPRIDGSGAVDTLLTASKPTWNREDVQNSYQWFRGNSPIPGATGTTYLVTVADYRQPLTVRVTGRHLDYAEAVAVSDRVTASEAPPVTETVRPLIRGTGVVGSDLVAASEPAWLLPGVVPTFRWVSGPTVLRHDGAAARPYTVREQDSGTPITLEVTGRLTGYADSVLLSNTVQARPGQTLRTTRPFTVRGNAALGQWLDADGPAWDQERVTTTFQWLRNGTPIPGETAWNHRVVAADIGKRLSVRVTGTKQGFHPGGATSPPKLVPRQRSSVQLTVSTPQQKLRRPVKLTVTVVSDGFERSTGRVQFKDGKQVLKTVTLNARSTATFSTKKLKKGTRKLRAVYLGHSTVVGSTSPVVRVTITRR